MLKLNDHYKNQIEQENLRLIGAKKAKGMKVVGVYCAFTPKELIAASGGIPVSLCGGSNKPIPAAEQHLPRNLCPLIKSSYGFALTETCPYFDYTDFLIADSTCDGKKKMYERLQKIRPLYLLQLPQTYAGESALNYWLSELRRLRRILENELGREITDDGLREKIHIYNQCRSLVRQVYELNAGKRPLLTGKEISIATDQGGYEVDLPGYLKRLKQVIKFAKERGSIDAGPRILLTGCPTTCKKVLDIIEQKATVVAMENCGALKTVLEPVDETEKDPLLALAKKYIRIACPCMSPNPGRYEILANIVGEYQIDGVVDLTWQACHTYNVESTLLGDFVREELGKPFIQIETDFSDSDTDWIKVRVDAFIEML